MADKERRAYRDAQVAALLKVRAEVPKPPVKVEKTTAAKTYKKPSVFKKKEKK